jgi:hypothetical protein
VRAILGGPCEGREITLPSAPELIVAGYEGIIGPKQRSLSSRGHIRHALIAALKGTGYGL